jgi:hypothetical protein
MNSSSLDQKCGKHFIFSDFIECGETQQYYQIENTPEQTETFLAMEQICSDILDPVIDSFGEITLTYGFCSKNLEKQIKKNESPRILSKLDQHAGYELDSKGYRICERLGFAVDFISAQNSSLEIMQWIARHLKFDRIYFYGSKKPLHVSIGPDESHQCVAMLPTQKTGRRMPRKISRLEPLPEFLIGT